MRRLSQEEIELIGGNMSDEMLILILSLSGFLLILVVLYAKYKRG